MEFPQYTISWYNGPGYDVTRLFSLYSAKTIILQTEYALVYHNVHMFIFSLRSLSLLFIFNMSYTILCQVQIDILRYSK